MPLELNTLLNNVEKYAKEAFARLQRNFDMLQNPGKDLRRLLNYDVSIKQRVQSIDWLGGKISSFFTFCFQYCIHNEWV